jgi:small-conductance mechanosensitive channel
LEEKDIEWFQQLMDNTYNWLTDTAVWMSIGIGIIKIIGILILAKIATSVLKKASERLLKERTSGPVNLSEKRSKTLTSLIHNIIVNVIFFIAILLILGELGFNLGPLLAGAGVLGLAIGFGAQNLVRDVITGFFIVYEDQFAVGDFIATGKFTGTVQEIGLRITKIKEWTGQIHIIPNGSITDVTNFSKENSVAVLDIGVAYEENISRVEETLVALLKEYYPTDENIVAEPTVMGVQNLGASDVVVRVAAECLPMMHYGVARKLRKAIKDRFDETGIEIPYPRMVTLRREDGPGQPEPKGN